MEVLHGIVRQGIISADGQDLMTKYDFTVNDCVQILVVRHSVMKIETARYSQGSRILSLHYVEMRKLSISLL